MSHNSTYALARVLSKAGLYLLAGCLGLPIIALAQGESNSSITLYPNNTSINSSFNAYVVSQNNEIVTMGIPFADCTLYDSNNFRLFDDTGTEVQVHVETLMEWPAGRQPCGETSVRVLQVQFEFDATGGAPVVYHWDLLGPRATADYGSAFNINAYEVVHSNPIKGGFMEPRVFAINDPSYLVQTGLMPPTAPYTPGDYDDHYYPATWEVNAKQFDFTSSSSAQWLFDRVSAQYRQAMRTGDPLLYREAYVSHEFYIDKIEVTGQNTNVADYCIGGFDFDGKANNYSDNGSGCDGKYFYTQNIRLHLALTGDDSWVPSDNGTPTSLGVMDTRDEAWIAIADLLREANNRGCAPSCGPAVGAPGFAEPYDNVGDYFNERSVGVGLQTVLSSCQLTLDATVCGWADAAINYMYDMQTANPDGRGNLGYLAHSWRRHEGSHHPYVGTTVQAYTNATTITVKNAVEDSPGSLSNGNTILQSAHYELIADPVDNLDGTWDLRLATPLTIGNNTVIRSGANDIENTSTRNSMLDIPSDRAFSPWMQSMVADGVWEYYFWTEDATQKAKAEALLLGFGRAIAANAIDGIRLDSTTKTLVESAFDITIFSTPFTQTGCGMTISPVVRYAGNNLMGTDPDINLDYMTYILKNSSTSDHHTPEALFQLSLGILFETDPQKKAAMQALADDMQEWFAKHTCTADRGPNRALNWQTKPDPFGTYQYVMSQGQSQPQSQSELYYSGNTFTESQVNDGSIANTHNITLVDAEFDTVGVLTKDTQYLLNGDLPGGLTPVVTVTGAGSATFTLSGNAANNDVADNVTNLELVFLDAAFDNVTAAQLENSTKSGLAIQFADPPVVEESTLAYDSNTFFELNSNAGESTTTLTATLSDGETFVISDGQMNGSHFSTANVPSNMTVKVTGTSSTTATVELTGNATSHSADVTNLTVTFHDAAFNGANAAFVDGSSKNDLIIDFKDAIITYGNNAFIEAEANDGSTNTILNLDLTFVSFVNAVFESPTHYSVSNIPDGLIAQVNRTGPASVTFALTGAAVNNEDSNDMSNIQLAFNDAAFTNGDASTVVNAIKSNINVDFANNPVDEGEGTETPIGGVDRTETPTEGGGETETPAEGGGETETPTEGGGETETPAEGGGETETPTEGGGETETPIGGVDRTETPTEGGGETETQPDYENIQVDPGTEFVNDGTLTDVNNQGTIIGGMLDGEVNNQGGVLVDVTLLPGARISGGTVLGHLMGSGSVSNTLLDLESIDNGIEVGYGTQVTSSTVSNVPGLDLTAAILEESGVPDIDLPFLIDSEIGDFSLAGLIELALNAYFGNANSVISVNADGKVVLTNDALKWNSVIPVELSRIVTRNWPDGVTLTRRGTMKITYHGISSEFAPTSLVRIFPRTSRLKFNRKTVARMGTAQLLSVEGSSMTSNATLHEDGLVSIQLGDITLFQRFGWMATMPDTTPLLLNAEGEATFELIGSSSDPVSQQVIVHYPDNSTQALIPFLDSLTEFGSIVSQSEYEASISIDPLTGIMQFFDPAMNLIFTAIPDVVSLPAEHGITGAVLENAGDRNGDGYPDFYFKTPVRTQLIYGLSP